MGNSNESHKKMNNEKKQCLCTKNSTNLCKSCDFFLRLQKNDIYFVDIPNKYLTHTICEYAYKKKIN